MSSLCDCFAFFNLLAVGTATGHSCWWLCTSTMLSCSRGCAWSGWSWQLPPARWIRCMQHRAATCIYSATRIYCYGSTAAICRAADTVESSYATFIIAVIELQILPKCHYLLHCSVSTVWVPFL